MNDDNEPLATQIVGATRNLGRLLVGWRGKAGITQFELAGHLPWSRSTIANIETGRQYADRAFWTRCEVILGADGALIAAFEHLDRLRAAHRAQVARSTPRSPRTPPPQVGPISRITVSHRPGGVVEVRRLGQLRTAGVRYSAIEWAAFVRAVKSGVYDRR